jgi:hypothetical protein
MGLRTIQCAFRKILSMAVRQIENFGALASEGKIVQHATEPTTTLWPPMVALRPREGSFKFPTKGDTP